MNLLKEVEDSLRYWTECAVRDHILREKSGG